MLSVSERRDNLINFVWLLFLLAVALGVSAAVVRVWELDLNWAVAGSLAILLPFVLWLVPDSRKFLLGLMIFSIPLNADYNFFKQYANVSGASAITLSLTDILLFLLIGQWLIEMAAKKHVASIRFFPRISWPTLALIAMMAMSMVASENLLWSALDIVAFIKAFIFFIYLANNIRSREELSYVIKIFFVGVILQSIIILLQLSDSPSLYFLRYIGVNQLDEVPIILYWGSTFRPGGTVGTCNHLARFYGFLLPLAIIVYLVSRSRNERWIAGLAAVVGTIGFIYTLSRSSWAAMIPSVIVIFIYMFSRGLLSLRIIHRIGIILLAFAVLALLFGELVWQRVTAYDYGTGRTRFTTAKVAARMIQDHPIAGVGINNYGLHTKDYFDSEELAAKRWIVHNTYLLYAAEIGIIGFVAFAWLLVAFFSSAYRALSNRSRYLAAVGLGVLSAFVGFAVSALGDKSYKDNMTLILTFWALAAIVEAINRLDEEYDQASLKMMQNRSLMYEF